MAYFAKIGLNFKVIDVVVVDDKHLTDSDNNLVEELGRQYLENNSKSKWPHWVLTTNETSVGDVYDEATNTFTSN
jgi:hypothetical protein